MDENLIREAWEQGEDCEMPDVFMRTCKSFWQSKCAMGVQDFTMGDFATCVMLYKLARSVGRGGRREGAAHG